MQRLSMLICALAGALFILDGFNLLDFFWWLR